MGNLKIMSKKNSLKPNMTAKEAAQLTESQLKEQAELKRQEREKALTEELNEWCKKNNCSITPAIAIHIQGQPLGVKLTAL